MRRPVPALLGAVLLIAVAGCGTDALGATGGVSAGATTASASPSGRTAATPTATAGQTAAPTSSHPAGTALAALETLPVKGRAPRTGYDRDLFGPRWADVDRNGCDTRNDVLRRDLRGLVLKAGTHGCVVLSGRLDDPYTGRVISFVRGEQTSTAVQIDHVVALSDAWQKGAQQWSADERERFANDPLNLLAVDGPTNSRKSDGDAATWLPPEKSYRCTYVARQVAVKKQYGVWVTAAEKAAIARVLSSCPGQTLPRAGVIVLGGGSERSAASASSTTSTSGAAPVGHVYYQNCTAVRVAGAAPIHVGDPGYGRHLDRDGDGVGCE